jgi:hypothetical protein
MEKLKGYNYAAKDALQEEQKKTCSTWNTSKQYITLIFYRQIISRIGYQKIWHINTHELSIFIFQLENWILSQTKPRIQHIIPLQVLSITFAIISISSV